MKRGLSNQFMEDLQSGVLSNLLTRVKSDDTLMLAIRENYINIYYRGGNLLKLERKENLNIYNASFDANYAKIQEIQKQISSLLPKEIKTESDIETLINKFSFLKEIMDKFFSNNQKLEREFQQLVARENNNSSISNETEYFIADIELANSEIGARFDMLAFKWGAKKRQKGNVRLALVEMKYGDGALDGESGVIKHLKDISKLSIDAKTLFETAQIQINQLNQLDLLRHKKGRDREFVINTERLEIIFIFANSNPRSKQLLNILNDATSMLKNEKIILPNNVDLRFFIANSAGYAMHDACMYTLEEYTEFTEKILNR